jgi:hypothetical protein
MASQTFWEYFDGHAAPILGQITKWPRLDTFRQIFRYLDRFDRAVGIVETGCVRQKDRWPDGQSTVLFERYAAAKPGSVVYSVDLDPNATAACKMAVNNSDCVKVHTGDSVSFLIGLSRLRPADLPSLDLLYLDSFDVDFFNPLPSAIHHLKESLAAFSLLHSETLVVVDDSPMEMYALIQPNNRIAIVAQEPRIGGKGRLIAEYAQAAGIEPHFTGYQCGWVGLGETKAVSR